MDEVLLDTSWTLHHSSRPSSTAYRNLFSPSTNQAHLARYFDSLAQLYSSSPTSGSQPIDDLDDERERLGSFRECRYSISTLPPPPPPSSSSSSSHRHQTVRPQTPRRLIQVKVAYQNTAFTFVLYTPWLILTKAPASHTRTFVDHLASTFNIGSVDPLRLSSRFLGAALENYISTLVGLVFGNRGDHGDGDGDNDDDDDMRGLQVETLAALLRSSIGTLKLTVSFSGSVAPHLKTLELGVPSDTLQTLLSSALPAPTAKATTTRQTNDPTTSSSFLVRLAHHLHLQTGLKLPLDPSASDTDDDNDDETDKTVSPFSQEQQQQERQKEKETDNNLPPPPPPLRLSKITTAAFAIGLEGRLRFASRAIDHALRHENVVIAADLGLLDDVVREAERRERAGGHG